MNQNKFELPTNTELHKVTFMGLPQDYTDKAVLDVGWSFGTFASRMKGNAPLETTYYILCGEGNWEFVKKRLHEYWENFNPTNVSFE